MARFFPQTTDIFWLWLTLLLLGCQQAQKKEENAPKENQYRVIGIKDGDTIEILKDGKGLTVRLQGVDAPEKNQDYGTRAREFASDLAFGKYVELVVRDIDRYGRTVGDILLPDGRSLNHELVKQGYAWHYTAYSKDQALAQLELEARAQKRGLWAGPTPVAPWEFRKNRKTASAAAKASLPKKANSGTATITNKSGKAFICTGSNIYHLDQNCRSLKRCKSGSKSITAPQAKSQGKAACKVCAV
ncbi:thermonuclease family protein [Rufibacter sp. LB8]|uniref:thermonuclease family protein n=1 Tax=Rufibacter sp. LB8 TaxID=2777781 RepID=UPI00178C3570|nr:thermonuclease family protein [Rufibacter sp. LB8]